MNLYSEEGLVLKTQKLGEADRIVTIFTKTKGVRRFAVKGVRKTTSKFGASLEPFMHIHFQAYIGRTLDTVTQAQIINGFGDELTASYDGFLAANVLAEATEKIAVEQAFYELYLLLYGAIRALSRKVITPEIIRDAFLTRAISLAGWAPELERCAVCGSEDDLIALSLPAGGSVCRSCRPAGSFTVLNETILLLKSYLHGDWKTSLSSSAVSYKQAAGFIANYLQWHLDHSLKSLTLSQRTITTG